MAVQYLAGAGHGAVYRGTRVQPRDIDLPLYLFAANRPALQQLQRRLSLALAEEATLRLVDDDGTSWTLRVHRVGGGSYMYGADTTGTRDLQTVVTLRAADPFWTHSRTQTRRISNAGSGRGLVSRLVALRVSGSQAIGTMQLDNTLSDAPAYPMWTITGPGHDLDVRLPEGIGFTWRGTLSAGERLIIDTKAGTAYRGAANAYADFAPAPKLFAIPAGTTTVRASLLGVTSGSSIVCTWQARRWAVI